MAVQSKGDLEHFYERPDPWGYEDNPGDLNRRARLLAALPEKPYARVLDIGCGEGFVTSRLPGDLVVGIDLSANAVARAKSRSESHVTYMQRSLFDLPHAWRTELFDLIVVTGVLYPQYIGRAYLLAFTIIDNLLKVGGHLVCSHIFDWYKFRFPYTTLTREYYRYRDYTHVLEVYVK